MNALAEIREVFERELSMKDIHFIGRTCMGRIEGNLRGKIDILGASIRISILDRTSGLVDEMRFLMSDVTGCMLNKEGRYITPNLHFIDGTSWWNCSMEEQAYHKIADAINGYMEMFQSEAQTQETEQGMGMASNISY